MNSNANNNELVFKPWSNLGESSKYTNNEWCEHQMELYFKKYGIESLNNNVWKWIQSTNNNNCPIKSFNTFRRRCTIVRNKIKNKENKEKNNININNNMNDNNNINNNNNNENINNIQSNSTNINEKNKIKSKLNIKRTRKNEITNQIANIISKNYSFEKLILIFDSLSNRDFIKKDLQNLQIGQCILGCLNILKTLKKLNENKNSKISKMHKQIILNSLLITNEKKIIIENKNNNKNIPIDNNSNNSNINDIEMTENKNNIDINNINNNYNDGSEINNNNNNSNIEIDHESDVDIDIDMIANNNSPHVHQRSNQSQLSQNNNILNININNMNYNNNINNNNINENINDNNINDNNNNNISNNNINKNNDNNDSNKTTLIVFETNKKNLEFLRNINNKNAQRFKQLCEIRKQFDSNNSKILYNIDIKKDEYMRNISKQVEDNICKYWKENTQCNPSVDRHVYLKNKKNEFILDEYGNKIKHPIHYINIRLKQFYKNWCKDETTVELLNKLNCSEPSFGLFLSCKPNYIRKGKKIEYSKCQYCYNFEQLWNVWKREINNLCTCNTVSCNNFNIELNKCNNNCNDCSQCWFHNNKINIDYRNIHIHAFCTRNEKPKQKCVDSECMNCDGGNNFFYEIINMCKSCNVSDEIYFDFFQLESKQMIRNGKKQRENVKILYSLKYSEFIKYFKNKYTKYIKHRADKHNQEHIRSKIYKPLQNNNILLPNCDIFCSIDYIENIKTYYSEMSSSMFRDLGQISFCEIYQISNDNNNLKRTSHCYLSGDVKHDTWMSLYNVKKHIQTQKQILLQTKNIQLRNVYFWSDRSPKEFSNTAFLQGLLDISIQLNVNIIWNFTAPNHGKWLHDSEGSAIKGICKCGIFENTLNFNSNEKYENTVANYLNNYFRNNDTRSNLIRYFNTSSDNDIIHKKNEWNTLDGIKNYYCFRTFNNQDNIKYRKYSCYCNQCLSNNWNNCINKDICGDWKQHHFVKGKYCICKGPYDRAMLACDQCNDWFHLDCVGFDINDYDNINNIEWKCHICNPNPELNELFIELFDVSDE